MIELKKKKLDKKHIALIATSCLLVLLITAYIIISAVINSLNTGAGTQNTPTESKSLYPKLEKSQIQTVEIVSHEDIYYMMRATDKDGNPLSYFVFYYEDEDGNLREYMPDISTAESGFNYTDFYAKETSDGLNVAKIDYLLARLCDLRYDYSVPLKEDEEEKQKQLELYGLTDDEKETITISYLEKATQKDENGKDVETWERREHKIEIGDRLISGYGYYLKLDKGEFIYSSASSRQLSYALMPFESIINSRIVAEGLTADKGVEPYLTTDYIQWKSYYRDFYTDADGNRIPLTVTEDSEVIFNADTLTPVYKKPDKDSPLFDSIGEDGYSRFGVDKISLNLSEAKKDSSLSRLVAALVGRKVDEDGKADEKKTVTVINGMNEATLWDAENGKGEYTYTIRKIESVLDDTDEYFSGPVLGKRLVKVSYDYKIDGEAQNDKPAYAVIDLDADSVIPSELKEKIRSASVGAEINDTFIARYTKDNAKKMTVSYVISQISYIYEIDEESNKVSYLDKVEEDSIVSFSYHTVIKYADGTEAVGKAKSSSLVDLSKVKDGYDLDIKNALIGKAVGEVDIKVPVSESYYQPFDDFVTYEITGVAGFVEREAVVAFRFVNASSRDPFYAETSYKNTLAEIDPDNPHAIYALEVESCDWAVRLLGGISSDGASGTSSGLVGIETVAVGLTPEVMKEYGLYEGHKVYFSLPRGLSGIDEEDEENPHDIVDYTWASELGFTLYISNPDENGMRYIGSDMYDVVVKIDGSSFEYLDEPFADFWARRKLAMVKYTDINNLGIKFNFEDLVGEYNFELEFQKGHPYIEDLEDYNYLEVNASIKGFKKGEGAVTGVYTETGLSKLMAEKEKDEFLLSELYNHLYLGTGEYEKLTDGGYDTLGTANFQKLLEVIYASYYMGTVDVESDEIQALLDKEALFTISFDVGASSAINKYVYEFRRLDDRRIVVSFFMEDNSGAKTPAVSDLYISDQNFKKIVNSVLNLLNGRTVEVESGY